MLVLGWLHYFCWRPCRVGGQVVAFIPAVAYVPADAVDHATSVYLLLFLVGVHAFACFCFCVFTVACVPYIAGSPAVAGALQFLMLSL